MSGLQMRLQPMNTLNKKSKWSYKAVGVLSRLDLSCLYT